MNKTLLAISCLSLCAFGLHAFARPGPALELSPFPGTLVGVDLDFPDTYGVRVVGNAFVGSRTVTTQPQGELPPGTEVMPVAYAFTLLDSEMFQFGCNGLKYVRADSTGPFRFTSVEGPYHYEVSFWPKHEMAWGQIAGHDDVEAYVEALRLDDGQGSEASQGLRSSPTVTESVNIGG